MRIATSKMRRILYLMVICLAVLAVIAPMEVPISKTAAAQAQQPAFVKTGAFTNVETMLSRLLPFYKMDSLFSNERNGVNVQSFLSKLGLSNKLIVPEQEPGKISIIFKGRITKGFIAQEGKVNLVLRIYDQSNGETKLYEGTHEAQVSRGIYLASIQVPSETIANSQTIWLEAASAEEKELPFEPRRPFAIKQRGREGVVPNAQTATAVALCFSCGGPAPYTEGQFKAFPDSTTYEYDDNCGGVITYRNDTYPFLCAGFRF